VQFDDAAVKEFGVRWATHMVGRIFLESDVRVFHFCTLNLENSVRCVVENLGWVDAEQQQAAAAANGVPDSPTMHRNLMLSVSRAGRA
jgi:methylenetetrahydrofolate reductase (NADPH)